MAYWIFNDNLEFHAASFGSQPMKIEIHASAYSYACPNILNRDSIINYTTFYNYKIFNRNNINYDSCYIANWSDFDIGYEFDDGLASAPQNNFIYAYNFDSLDHNYSFPTNSYELNPPIISDVVLSGPLAYLNDTIDNDNDGLVDELGEKNLLTGSLSYHDDFALSMGNPSAPIHFYNFMQSRWRNGRQMTTQGWGDIGTIVTKYAFPNFPSDSGVWHCPLATDGSFIASSGPFLFPAGSSFDYDFAFVFSRDTTLTYNSAAYYQMAVSDVQRVKYWFDNNNAPSCLVFPGISETAMPKNNLLLFPNPTHTLLNIQLLNGATIQAATVFDLVGKQVNLNQQKNVGTCQLQLDINAISPGIFLISIQDKAGKYHYSKFVKE
ncbi:MAG: T9SS type A sorting domain-containing protein [Bacteroidetes bacterium]|nr:T9SS type A sorting domain-containing protein [Bacteroidota bacterium]